MKRKWNLICVLILSLNLILPVGINATTLKEQQEQQTEVQNDNEVVEIPDEILRANIEMELDKDSGDDITKADMQDLYTLSIPRFEETDDSIKVKDLTGLEYATNLTWLDLSYNNVSDITPLTNLNNMINLNLKGNQISDLTPLSTMQSLDTLNLNENKITDISPIVNNLQLRELDLETNAITEIPQLNMPNLSVLRLSGNNISDINALETSTTSSMLSCIGLDDNKLTDLRPIGEYDMRGSCPPSGAKNESKMTYYAELAKDQNVELEPIEVNQNMPITTTVYDPEGNAIEVELAKELTPGLNKLSGSWKGNYTSFYDDGGFTGVVTQDVYYNVLSANDNVQSNEETILSNEQLIDLFNVTSATSDPINVDATQVNYHVPGKYPVVFTQKDSSGTEIGKQDVTIEIKDVIPEIIADNEEVEIKLGEAIDDYESTFGIKATEIIDGDLTNQLKIDDSNVNYNQTGTYPITLSVVDEEGNSVNKTVNVKIVRDLTTPVTPVTPDVDVQRPDKPDTLTPEVDAQNPDTPDPITPDPITPDPVIPDDEKPKDPGLLTPDLDNEKPKDPGALTPGGDSVDSDKSEVVNPEVSIPEDKTLAEKLENTGQKYQIQMLIIIITAILIVILIRRKIR